MPLPALAAVLFYCDSPFLSGSVLVISLIQREEKEVFCFFLSHLFSPSLSLSFPVRKNFPKRSLTDRLPRTSNRWLLPPPISKLIVGRGRKWAIMQAIWALKKSFQRPAMYQYITLPSHQIVQFPLPFHLCGWLFAPTYRRIFRNEYDTLKKLPKKFPFPLHGCTLGRAYCCFPPTPKKNESDNHGEKRSFHIRRRRKEEGGRGRLSRTLAAVYHLHVHIYTRYRGSKYRRTFVYVV